MNEDRLLIFWRTVPLIVLNYVEITVPSLVAKRLIKVTKIEYICTEEDRENLFVIKQRVFE